MSDIHPRCRFIVADSAGYRFPLRVVRETWHFIDTIEGEFNKSTRRHISRPITYTGPFNERGELE
ncbi:hypothetical protein [Manganibacter manganicus]|uniref:Uncharacterized protein n=1 Tax=Manganibacter manganicus TaxID=1873176 RepID=A0A1V8RP24_9HYPH|nr:hypothetical protein [Pseudaminobacter manganicus]OQM74918.1 hypothetical protein BFN67_04705 [Pseudaminobacter manganicus]